MTNRNQRLGAYIAEYYEQRTVPGASDCATWTLEWVKRETGRAVKIEAYASWEEAEQKLAKASLLSLASAALEHAGLSERIGDPQPGDVAVIELSDRQSGCIVCHAGIVAIRGEHKGVFYLLPDPGRLLRVWAIE